MQYCFYTCKMSKVTLFRIFFVVIFLFSADSSFAKKQSLADTVSTDSLKSALKYQDSILHKAKKSDTSINNLLDKIEYYTASYNQLNRALSKNIDTADISSRLPQLERGIKIIKETLTDNDNSSTLRYLYAVRDILTHIEDRLDDWQEKLSESNTQLVKLQAGITKFREDPALNYIPSESKLRNQYIAQLSILNAKFAKLESISRNRFLRIGLLQNRIVQNYVIITDYKNQISLVLNKFGEKSFNKEYPYLWQSKPADYPNTLLSAWQETVKMNKKLLTYFAISNYDVHLWGLLFLAAFFYWVTCSIKKIKKNHTDTDTVFSHINFIIKHPMLSSVLVCGIIILFFYDHPPVIFVEMLMLVLLVCTGVLIRSLWPKNVFNYWLLIIGIVIFYDISNLFIKICYADRITVFVLSIVCLTGSFAFIRHIKESELKRSPWYFAGLRFFIILQFASLLLNIFGRFSIAKLLGFASISGLWQAVTLYLFVSILMEAIFLQLEANKSTENLSSYFDYKILESRLKNILNIVAFIFWLIWVAENFNIIDFLIDFFTQILSQEHVIGDTKFTFGNVLVFVIIIWIASTLSKVITYFFEFADQHAVTSTRKSRLSSSILLVKLSIFGLGFLLAIIASSIPVAKINIIIGALSVGIGFGLQTIVNNLVSGVILAFEKPVQIGDLIEVGGHSGRIKEMGIRASKIATYEGSEIIVPNGDLLSQHLVNWTLSNNNRRVELLIGVAYGTELKKVKQLLFNLIIDREGIMKEPDPLVLIHNFGDNSVDFRVLFWVADLSKWLELKSQVMSDIYESFYNEGIEIPFPQRDVHLHYPPEETEKVPVKTVSPIKDNPEA